MAANQAFLGLLLAQGHRQHNRGAMKLSVSYSYHAAGHKQRTGCNGKRKRTEFVPIREFDDGKLLSGGGGGKPLGSLRVGPEVRGGRGVTAAASWSEYFALRRPMLTVLLAAAEEKAA